MSTRAVYSFRDERSTHHVYKHWDGYPSGAAKAISDSLSKAWPLPRFEADEFSAAFVAANKTAGGDLRLTDDPGSHGDLEFRYEIYSARRELRVTCFSVANFDRSVDGHLFDGTLVEFQTWADEERAT